MPRKKIAAPAPPPSAPAEAEQHAKVALAAESCAALTITRFAGDVVGEQDPVTLMTQLREATATLAGEGLPVAERMLLAQACSLQSIFTAMANRAGANVGHSLDATESYMKLALRAQNQCRMTLETLSVIRNPPQQTVFAKQANVTSGPQQINNGTGASPPRAGEGQNPQNQLLETTDGERLDTRATGKAVGAHPVVATLEEVDRTTD